MVPSPRLSMATMQAIGRVMWRVPSGLPALQSLEPHWGSAVSRSPLP